MSLRKQVKKWLYGSCPGFAGAFPYFGTKVYFPKGCAAFFAACDQGTFEGDNVRLLTALVRSETYCLDVGTNIGLMSLPVLKVVSQSRVVSFEASPNVLPYLARTISGSGYGDRWTLVPKAAGAITGKASFSLSSPENSMFDGLESTKRVETVGQVEVEVTTLDSWWHEAGMPKVSVIKCDVEGAELEVLKGARECLASQKPYLLLEWNALNLHAYHCAPGALLEFASASGYLVYALPHLVGMRSAHELVLHMTATESFLMAPE